MTVWENPLVADKLDEYIALDDGAETALSMIPTLFGTSEKATYLVWRGLGFSTREALGIMGLEEGYLEYWNNTDKDFLRFEAESLPRLQKELPTEVVKLGYTRNIALFVAKDAVLLRKFITDPDSLTKREWDYVVALRKHYTPNDLYNLEKALNPDAHKENLNITLNWGQPQPVLEGVQVEYQSLEAPHGNPDPDPQD